MAMTGSSSNSKQKQKQKRPELLDFIFSWSLSDILNKHLYKFQVKEVPLTFSSTTHYMNSFIYLLLEETRADLFSHFSNISQAPASPVACLQRISTDNHKELFYRIILGGIMNYAPTVGDLIALTQVKPKCIDDLARPNSFFLLAYVTGVCEEMPMEFIMLSSSHVIESNNTFETMGRTKGFVVYLTNMTTNMRIWQALNPAGNMDIIRTTLSFSSSLNKDCDKCCTSDREKGVIDLKLRQSFDSFKLDTSQQAAVLSCLAANKCYHGSSCTKLIWGPPGTGKTKTIASLLFVLLRTKHRTLTCAPTNVAVVGVAKRLVSLLISDYDLGCDTYGLGDIVLFGNQDRMKIDIHHKELLDVFLDNRIKALGKSLSLWKTYTNDTIRLLENPMKEHRCFVGPKKTNTTIMKNKENKRNPDKNHEEIRLTFEEFVMNRWSVLGNNLIACIRNLYTHLPTSVIPLGFAKKMNDSVCLLQKFSEYVKEIVTRNQSLKVAFDTRVKGSHFEKLRLCKTECLRLLKDLSASSIIPKSMSKAKLTNFCLRNACLIFCTASSSIKLHREGMTQIKMVLIDEAAQLKECESLIPLQLPGVQNVVLVGDERQLPAMVQSKILDAPNVIDKAREKRFLQEDMYGSYSFINVDSAKEELDKNNSTKNMMEVAVIAQILAYLFEESVSKKQKVTVGCISPYKAQVEAIQAKIGNKYNRQANDWSFNVNIRSVDGFQGSEEDVIIFSTVRCNPRGSVGFLSSRERANVALTRARHCLWIVGNKETMIKSGSVWNALVYDAENRGCVYDAHEDKNLAQIMVTAMMEFTNFGSLLKTDSVLFKDAKWKVNFTNTFHERIAGISNLNVRKLIVSLLVKLSSGWRKKKNKGNSYDTRGMLNMLEIYNVNGHLHLVWSVDIAYENSLCVQVLKFWDILSFSQIKQHAEHLESAFGSYTFEMISRCQTRRVERNLVIPMTWPVESTHHPALVLTSQLAKLSLHDQT